MKYTDYCTCFFIEEKSEIWFWDEIKDRKIGYKKVKDGNEANKIMKEWGQNAPKNCICEIITWIEIEKESYDNWKKVIDCKKFVELTMKGASQYGDKNNSGSNNI